MEMDNDFQIITNPICESKPKKTKPKLNRVSKKNDLVSKDRSNDSKNLLLKPKWCDEMYPETVHKISDGFDFEKIAADLNRQKSDTKRKSNFNGEENGENLPIEAEMALPRTFLEYRKIADGNYEYHAADLISAAIFHRQKKCLLTTSRDGSICVFQVGRIDGASSHQDSTGTALRKPLLLSKFPLSGAALLGPSGTRAVLTSLNYGFFKVYCLASGTVTHHRAVDKTFSITRVAAAPGGHCAVLASRDNRLAIVDTVSFDTSAIVTVSTGPIHSVAFSHNGKYLYALHGANQGLVTVFEMADGSSSEVKFVRRWVDYGCVEPLKIAISSDDKYVAIGSPGVLNVYELNATWKTEHPVPVKSFSYPDTRINQLEFNNSSELLAIGFSLVGQRKKGGIRMVHLQSMTVFQNFPGQSSAGDNNQGQHIRSRPTCFSFSENSKYLAVGQCNGRVAMFDLKHYPEY